MLPDPGCYEERYRLAAGAAWGLAVGLVSLGLAYVTVMPWVTGVVIALALLALVGPAAAARRMIAFRADYAGVTLGAAPGKLVVRRNRAAFIPWTDVEKIIVYPAGPGTRDADRVPWIGVQRREGSPALPVGNGQAADCPIPGVAAGAARKVTGWRLDRERLAAVTAAVAPGIPIVEASTPPGPGVERPGQAANAPELGPTD
jgi:hypothetical protein